jgi:hypothetical protein
MSKVGVVVRYRETEGVGTEFIARKEVNYFADVEVNQKRIIDTQKSGIANKSASWE